MDFYKLDRWFDQLSSTEQAEIKACHGPLEELPDRLIPEDHGKGLNAHLEAGMKRFKELEATGKPFFLARVSDCEVSAIGCGYLPKTPYPGGEKNMHKICGIDRDFIGYRQELLDAFQFAALLGVQQNWLPWKINTSVIFKLLGWPMPHPRAIDIHLPYKMLVDGSLFSFLRRKRVLLIGALAPRLAEAWKSPHFHRAYERFGPVNETVSVEAIATKKRGEGGGCWRDIENITKTVQTKEYDVALLSAGTPAKILAKRICSLGKTALDVGFVFDALLGDPERKDRPAMRDIQWPQGKF